MELFKSRDIINKLLVFALLVFGLYPLIPERQESLSVIFLVVTSLLFFFKSKDRRFFFKRECLISASVFIVFVLSAFLSEDINEAFKKIETMLSLCVFPLVFFIFLPNSNINISNIKLKFLQLYFLSNIVYCLFSVIIFYNYQNPKYLYKDANFFRNALMDVPLIGEHPIYISTFLAIAILVGFTLYSFNKKILVYNIFIAFGQGFIFVILILLMSKSVVFALFCSGVIWALFKAKNKIYIIFFLFSLLISIIMLIPKSNNRFNYLLNKTTYSQLDLNNSTSIRINILKCNIDLIIKNPILGYGLGDVQNQLDNCYSASENKLPVGKYNSHNQYVFIWLSCGIFGLILFILFLAYYYRFAILNSDYLMLSIIILYSVVFIFENVLSRQSGVILFSFMMNFMLFLNNKKNLKF